jgi:hypothetical protein
VSIGSELKGAVAPAEEGVREEEQARGRRAMTRGGRGSRRWSGGGSTTAVARCSAPAAGGQSRAGQHMPVEEEERGGVRGPIWKSQKSQGPLVKLNFPTDVEV